MIFNINSTFKPFTFEDFAKPMIMYKQAYEDMEKNIATLTDQTEMWKNIAEQEKSPVAYNLYKSYSDKLNSVAEDFSRGMSMSNRGELLNLRKGYATNIVPIVNAYKRRQTLIDAAQDAALKNPTLEFQYDPRTMSLDDVIADPNKTWGNVINGALLTEQAGKMAANLARAAQSGDKNAQKQLEQILPYQYEYIKKTGFDYSEVVRAITDPEHGAEALTRIIDTVMAGSGINDWTNLKDANGNFTKEGLARYKKIRSYAEQGLYNAIGQEQTQILKDDFGANMALEGYKAQLAAAAAAGDGQLPEETMMDTDTLTFATEEEDVKERNEAAKLLGYNTDTKKFADHVPVRIVAYNKETPSASQVYTINPRLWNKKGDLMLRKNEFIAQGRSNTEKKALAEYWDKAWATAGKWNARTPHRTEKQNIFIGLDQVKRGNYGIKALKYNTDDNVAVIAPFVNSGQLVEIQGMDSKGNLKLNRPGVNHAVGISQDDIESFNQRVNPDKGKATLTSGQVSIHILPGDLNRPDNQGVVISFPNANGKNKWYLLRPQSMSDNVKSAFAVYNQAVNNAKKEAKEKKLNAEQTEKYVKDVTGQELSTFIRVFNNSVNNKYSTTSVSTYDSSKEK